MKNGEIYHLWENFGDLYRYTFEAIPVLLMQYQNGTSIAQTCTSTALQNRTCTGTGQSCTGTDCSILTSLRILTITWSFRIQFE